MVNDENQLLVSKNVKFGNALFDLVKKYSE